MRKRRETSIGAELSDAVTPMMARMLKVLLPTMAPMATSDLRSSAARTEVLSSGSDVPMAMTVSPTTGSGTWKLSAMVTAEETRSCAPRGSITIPRVTKIAIV